MWQRREGVARAYSYIQFASTDVHGREGEAYRMADERAQAARRHAILEAVVECMQRCAMHATSNPCNPLDLASVWGPHCVCLR